MAAAFDPAPGGQSGSLTTPADVIRTRELHRWEERCRRDAALADAPWPQPQAVALVDAILGSLATNETAAVDAAARAWARSSPSVSTLVRQMGALREVLASDDVCAFPDLDDRLVRIMDHATTTATAAALAELEDAALTDALTGVGNRRALDTAATAALAAADRAEHVVSVVVVDLDGLKAINDTHGHAAGDQAIAGLTDALRRTLRDSDQLFRIGGDEFVALLPMAPIQTVTELMSRAAVDAPAFSWGVATAPDDGIRLEDLLERADQRLYDTRRRTRIGLSRGGHGAGSGDRHPADGETPAAGRRAALPAATPTAARPRLGTNPPRRHRLGNRRAHLVGAVVVASAVLGVALHVLTAPAAGRPGHHGTQAPAGATGGAPAAHGSTAGPGPTPSAGTSSTGTGTTGRSAGTPGAGSASGTGASGAGAPTGQGAGQQAGSPGTTTTTTAAGSPTTTTLVPGLPNLGGTVPPPSLP